jgi:hypothetical protein
MLRKSNVDPELAAMPERRSSNERRAARVYFQPFSLAAPEIALTGWSAPEVRAWMTSSVRPLAR